MNKVAYDSAKIYRNVHCNDYCWPVIFVCCNGSFREFKDADEWDWWVYCSNKSCQNHDGEGKFQNSINWISSD